MSEEEVHEVGGDQGWSSDEDISPAEDSGDEYVPPGSRGERESDLEFSGFSGVEEDEEEEEEHHSVSLVEEESDGESEGDGPEVLRGGRGRARGRTRGRARSPASSGDEGWSEDPPPPPPRLCTHTRQDLA